jgi:hypothetical protein
MAVKAVVEERSARACSGRGGSGRRGGRGVVRRGGPGAPFYRVGGEAGWPDGEGNRAVGWCGGGGGRVAPSLWLFRP